MFNFDGAAVLRFLDNARANKPEAGV